MARVSRRNKIAAAQTGQLPSPMTAQIKKSLRIYRVAVYVRLSIMDTRDRKDSESLQTQIDYLCEYIARHPDLELYDCYRDNGETGTNFERAGFQRMMDDVKAGRVDCIIVKDLSRFGRDFLETGNFLEKVLPFMGVRFISINDNYDSIRADSGDAMSAALKNLMNDIYAKDISHKVFSALDIKKRNGEFIGNYAAYGYMKSPEDKHKLIVDPIAAPVVQRIFQMKKDGMSNAGIARILSEEQVPNPNHHRYLQGIIYTARYAQNDPWQTQAVKNILQNPVYLGHMAQGKKISKLYAGQRQKSLSSSEWVIVPNTHEDIISQELFDAVQEIMKARRDEYHSRLGKYAHFSSENIFEGLVVCACCKRNMTRYKSVYNNGRDVSFNFICPRHAALLDIGCPNAGGLSEDDLKAAVFHVIRLQISLLADVESIIKKVEKSAAVRTRKASIDNEISSAQDRRKRIDTLRQNLFESYASGIVSQADYLFGKSRYDDEYALIERRLEQLADEKAQLPETNPKQNKWFAAFSRFQEKKELSREMLLALVEKIYVNEDKQVHIILKYQDEMKKLLYRGCEYGEGF